MIHLFLLCIKIHTFSKECLFTSHVTINKCFFQESIKLLQLLLHLTIFTDLTVDLDVDAIFFRIQICDNSIQTQTTSSPSFAQSFVRDPKENHGKKWPREILSRALGSQVFARPFFSRGFLSRHARAHARRTKRKRDYSQSNQNRRTVTML